MLTPDKITEIFCIADGFCKELEQEKQREKAFNDLFSTAVSTVREPIESLFNKSWSLRWEKLF